MTDIERFKTAFTLTDPDDVEWHVSETQWENLACGDLENGDRDVVLDHIIGCRRCTEVHQALLVLREHAHTFDPGAPVPEMTPKLQRPRPSGRVWAFAGVLAVAAAFVVGVFPLLRPDMTARGPSAASTPTLRLSQGNQAATPLSPIGPISAPVLVFSWEPSPAVSVSVVQLIDESGEVVWTSPETESNFVEWPGDVARRPGVFYWRVLSVGGPGGGEFSSELVSFDLTEPLTSNPQ